MPRSNSACRRFFDKVVKRQLTRLAAILVVFLAPSALHSAELVQTIARIKPSVVGIGTVLHSRSPAVQFVGTGFIVADGRHVITNALVVDRPLDSARLEAPVVLISGKEGEPQARTAQLIAVDKEHDLAILKIGGEPLPALTLGDSSRVREGQTLAFTGFPIAMVLGFYPATHRGMIAAITPVVRPGITAKTLNAKMINSIRDSSYNVFQLDGTAYPGNSGSPLYDPDDGAVYGIINSVLVQGNRESALSRPSGITYAIPGLHIRDFLRREKIPGFE